MELELEELKQQSQAILEDTTDLVSGLTEAQMTWRLRPDSWSITDCLAHLVTVDGQDLPSLWKAIREGRRNGWLGSGPFSYPWWNGWFVKSMEPPVKRKYKPPDIYVPRPRPDPGQTVDEFRRVQHDLHHLLTEADGLDLARIKVAMPAVRWLKMRLGARLQLISAHDRRHLWQARQVKTALQSVLA